MDEIREKYEREWLEDTEFDRVIWHEVLGNEWPSTVSTGGGDYAFRSELSEADYYHFIKIPPYRTNIWADYEVLQYVRKHWDLDKLEHFLVYLAQRCMARGSKEDKLWRASALMLWYEVGDYSRAAYHVLHPHGTGDIVGDVEP